MSRTRFSAFTGASARVLKLFDAYHDLLIRWQAKLNLVAASTERDIWDRHFLDSAQLCQCLPPQHSPGPWIDVGSGAGFPGLVVSLLGYYPVHLVERNKKKAEFLREVISATHSNAVVHSQSLEDLQLPTAAVISARALAPLCRLLSLVEPISDDKTICFFPKGRQFSDDLTRARKYWNIRCKLKSSITDSAARIIIVEDFNRVGTD